ncbi:AAA family ATPase [Bradyrhizobium sp. HKCCYLS2033]|uniref:AAA family ATPase n=1 Tax=Bradyrhizobium TaxID=374 RepID=UPI003EBB5CD2
MNIERLDIESFKCFKSLQLPLAPLSVLTGFNGAGKSSAIQPLLLFAQEFRSSVANPGAIALNGSLVSLGTVGDVVNRDSRAQTSFSFLTSDEESVGWRLAPSRDRGSQYMDVLSMNYAGPAGSHSSREVCPAFLRQTKLFQSIQNIVVLSPVREARLEAYPAPQGAAQINGNVGVNGEFAPWWYVQCADDEVDEGRRHPEEERITVRGQIDAWLNELFPGGSVNVEAISKTSLSRLEFGLGTSEWRRPANIGYGFSYVFPLLVALLTMRLGQVLVVDTPEGHLHPRAQSVMGMMLAYFAEAGLQIIVESHSDHLLSGVRLAVKRNLINKDKAALHFFAGKNSEGSIAIISPSIDDRGAIDCWPEGFFDQTEKDLAELSDWEK